MKNLLKISEFAALSGISRQLLIYYDKEGILHPAQVDGENQYRYYSYHQLTAASVIVSLRQAGMPLACIRDYLVERTPQKLLTVFREQEKSLSEQIQKLERIRKMVESRLEHTERGLRMGGERVWAEQRQADNLFLGPALPKDYRRSDGWECLPEFYKACKAQNIQIGLTVGSLVPYDPSAGKLQDTPSQYFCRLPMGQYPDFYTRPAGLYLVGTQFTDYGSARGSDLYQKIFQYAEENGMEVCGNAYEEFLIDEIAERDANRYILQISVLAEQLS